MSEQLELFDVELGPEFTFGCLEAARAAAEALAEPPLEPEGPDCGYCDDRGWVVGWDNEHHPCPECGKQG